eukprot:350792-Chlamydomonas_euryale.AAC.7
MSMLAFTLLPAWHQLGMHGSRMMKSVEESLARHCVAKCCIPASRCTQIPEHASSCQFPFLSSMRAAGGGGRAGSSSNVKDWRARLCPFGRFV